MYVWGCTCVWSACIWTCMWRSEVNLESFLSHDTLCFCFLRQFSPFVLPPPPPTQMSPLHLVCLALVCGTESLNDLEFKDPPAPQFWGHKHTPPYLDFSMGSAEQTLFFMLATEAHPQLSHLPVHHCFFLASLFRMKKAIWFLGEKQQQ